MSCEEFYRSDEAVYLLLVVPVLFLVSLLAPRAPQGAVEARAARFVRRWAIVFALETMLDAIVTGPGIRWLGLRGAVAENAMLPFVLLGDFRVFLLVLVVARPRRAWTRAAAEAAAWTLVVPVVAGITYAALRAMRGVSPMILWLVYEIAFMVLALVWRERLVPARVAPERAAVRAYLRTLLACVAVYYAIWATADVLLLSVGVDAVWALRYVANQLYYALFVPFAYVRFFAAPYAATSRSAQAAR